MKTFKLILIFICSIQLLQIHAQTTHYLQNGKIIYEVNGNLSDITRGDTLKILKDYFLIKFSQGTTESQIATIETTNNLIRKYTCATGWIIYHVPDTNNIIADADSLLSQLGNSFLEFNYALTYFSSTPNDTEYPNQWYLNDIQIPDTWDLTTGNRDVTVAILDQGTEWQNPDIMNDWELGWNFVSDNQNTLPSGWMNWHGHMLTSIIAAKTNNNFGTSGIAGGWSSPPVKIAMYKISNDYTPNLALAAIALDYGLAHGIKLFNFSWGVHDPGCSGNYFPALRDAIDRAYDYGDATMFAAAGNVDLEEVAWPACSDKVIAVGGTNKQGNRWSELHPTRGSHYGTNTDISAPCVDILRPSLLGDPGPSYQTTEGTSCATAIAVGVAALMKSVNPCLSNIDMEYILKATADKTGGYIYDWDWERPGHSKELGYGKINAYEAVKMASSSLQEITSNTTFDTPMWFTHDLTVKSGNTLTIISTIKFTERTKIIVEKGARLLIDGGILTSNCTDFWGGIEVLGDRNLPQMPISNQGYLSIYNQGMIENADPGVNSHDGGIVIACDAIFRNNKRAVMLANYPYANQSYFMRCLFEMTNLPGWLYGNPLFTGNEYFIGAELVKSIQVLGCTFQNIIDLSATPFIRRGYGIIASNAEVFITGASTPNPGPDPTEVKSYFKNLNFGVLAQRSGNQYTIKISHSRFEDNLRGAYISGYNGASYAEVVLSKFKIRPPTDGPCLPYGIYLNNCSEYSVEDNELYNTTSTPYGLGLVINQSGIHDNTVYNNVIHKLEYGALAQNCNRNSDQSGLCFKCNDFYDNLNDIAITSDAGPGTPNQGIAVYQGNKTIPAGNTFTVTSSGYDIINPFDQITYAHDMYYLPNEEVIPDPTIGVSNLIANETTYNETEDCPSHFVGGNNLAEVLVDLSEAKVKADSLSQVLSVLVDGGSTGLLVDEVQNGTPSESIEIRDQLLQESPYLSDSVMVTAIQKEEVLPNAMIRDIMVANPQSAKTENLLIALDERVVPMPDSLMGQVMEGLSTTSAKEELTASLSGWTQRHLNAYKTLLREYSEDTTGVYGFDSIVSLVNSVGSLGSRYELAWLYNSKSMFVESNSVLNLIPQQFTLKPDELECHSKFVFLNSIMQQLISDSLGLQSLDSLQINELSEISADDRNLVGAYARNLLNITGHLQYNEPIILPESTTKSAWRRNFTSGTLSSDPYFLSVFPNPATSYFTVEYSINKALPQGASVSIVVTDISGHPLKMFVRTKLYDQIIIPTRELLSGTYLLSLKTGGVTRKTVKLVIL